MLELKLKALYMQTASLRISVIKTESKAHLNFKNCLPPDPGEKIKCTQIVIFDINI